MRTAIFGGTFDPVHSAHLTVAAEAANRFQLDCVLFVPAANPPHKTIGTPFEDRYAMVELACTADARFLPSRLEADHVHKSYSIDTVERVLTEKHGPIFFIIGADAFEEIATWHRWRELIAMAEFIVVARPGHAITVPENARVHRLETLALPVSSSEIRRKLMQGEVSAELPVAVAEYIRAHGLYPRSL